MIDTEGLPREHWTLDQAGADHMIAWVDGQRARSTRLASAFEEDPFGTVEHLFTLSEQDRDALRNTGNDRIRNKLRPVIDALREGRLKSVSFEMRVVELPAGTEPLHKERRPRFGCDCQMLV